MNAATLATWASAATLVIPLIEALRMLVRLPEGRTYYGPSLVAFVCAGGVTAQIMTAGIAIELGAAQFIRLLVSGPFALIALEVLRRPPAR